MKPPIIFGSDPLLSNANRDCIELLEEALREARKGTINTVGMVLCFKSGYAATMVGPKAAELNLAIDSLKVKILEAVREQQPTKQ